MIFSSINNNKMHTYEVNLKWTSERKGVLSSPVLPQAIEVATPPEFPKGIDGVWGPEQLLLASLSGCLMTTFFEIAENSKLEFISFENKATCIVEKVDGKYEITEITLKPKLTIPDAQNSGRAKRIIEMSEKACLVSNTIKLEIRLEPEIIQG